MKIEFKIISPEKLNSRNVSMLEEVWRKISSNIYISKDIDNNSRRVSGFSKLGILSLCIDSQDEFYVTLFNENPIELERDKRLVINSMNVIKQR